MLLIQDKRAQSAGRCQHKKMCTVITRNLKFNGWKDDLVFVESGQVDVQGVGEVRKVPILHDNHQVHHQNKRAEEGTRKFWNFFSNFNR